jgi:two-component system sensor histidine kinase HydH
MSSPTPRSARILVVADPAEAGAAVASALSGSGFRVRSARTGAEGLEAARSGFDVALVAHRLPDGDGAVLGPRLREHALDAEVILLAPDGAMDEALAAMRAGACSFVVRPNAPAELLVAVEQAARQSRLHAEKRDLARRAQVAEKLATVGTMTAGLSHEIRNPLNAASLQLQVMERRIQRLAPELQPPLVEPLRLVRDELKRLNGVLEDFLLLAKPREIVVAELDARATVEKVLEFLGGEVERRGIVLQREIPDGLPAIAGEEARLRQVLVNLLLNAFEATPSGGTVLVSARAADGDRVALAVEDSGGGIPPAAREQIFEPFFTTKARGSGLGLSIVHSVVAQHGGSISVGQSRFGGARFVVELPRWR